MFYQTCYPGNCACWNRANGLPLDELVRERFQVRDPKLGPECMKEPDGPGVRQEGAVGTEPEPGRAGQARETTDRRALWL